MDVSDLSWMVGKFITRVRFVEPSQWSFLFDADAGLGVECRWRLLQDGRVVMSDEDHLQAYDRVTALDVETAVSNLLDAQAITRITVRPGAADLLIDFGDSLRLEVLRFSSVDESWNVTSPSGVYIAAMGDGELVSF